jgi:hypothetical protein
MAPHRQTQLLANIFWQVHHLLYPFRKESCTAHHQQGSLQNITESCRWHSGVCIAVPLAAHPLSFHDLSVRYSSSSSSSSSRIMC